MEEKSNRLDTVDQKVRINFWLSRKLFDDANDICTEEEKSLSDVIREALKEYTRKYKIKQKSIGIRLQAE